MQASGRQQGEAAPQCPAAACWRHCQLVQRAACSSQLTVRMSHLPRVTQQTKKSAEGQPA